MGGTPAAPLDDKAVMQEGEGWRQDLEARGLQVLGNALRGPEWPPRSASGTGRR